MDIRYFQEASLVRFNWRVHCRRRRKRASWIQGGEESTTKSRLRMAMRKRHWSIENVMEDWTMKSSVDSRECQAQYGCICSAQCSTNIVHLTSTWCRWCCDCPITAPVGTLWHVWQLSTRRTLRQVVTFLRSPGRIFDRRVPRFERL